MDGEGVEAQLQHAVDRGPPAPRRTRTRQRVAQQGGSGQSPSSNPWSLPPADPASAPRSGPCRRPGTGPGPGSGPGPVAVAVAVAEPGQLLLEPVHRLRRLAGDGLGRGPGAPLLGVGDVLEVLEQVVGVDPGPAEDQLEVRLQPRAVERVGDPLDLGPAGGGQVVDGSVVEVVGPLDLVQGLVGPWVEPGGAGRLMVASTVFTLPCGSDGGVASAARGPHGDRLAARPRAPPRGRPSPCRGGDGRVAASRSEPARGGRLHQAPGPGRSVRRPRPGATRRPGGGTVVRSCDPGREPDPGAYKT